MAKQIIATRTITLPTFKTETIKTPTSTTHRSIPSGTATFEITVEVDIDLLVELKGRAAAFPKGRKTVIQGGAIALRSTPLTPPGARR